MAPHLWKRGGLWIPVNDIRTGDLYKQPTTVTVKNVETAKTLAHHMSGALYLAFLIALLSLQKRETEGGAFAGAITEAYRDGLDGDLFAGKDTVSMSAEDVDVVEFAILCDRAHQE
ncbi:hypothetical protein DH86_00002712, partial [Scytalidium sp. 3C]